MIKDTAVLEAEKTFDEFIQYLSSIRSDSYNIIPFAGSWTPGQLAEHVILSAAGFVEILNGPVEDTRRDPEQHVGQLTTMFLDSSTKMESPEFIRPEEREYDQQDQVHSLRTIKVGLLKAVQTANLDKLCTAFELPVLGYLSGAEAVTFTTVHTQRHLHQLKNMINTME